jgi:hypothetical protein
MAAHGPPTPTAPAEQASGRVGRRWPRLAWFAAFQAAATLGLCELAARAVTTTRPETGMAMIGQFALLPYRPAPDVVRAAIQREGAYLVRDRELGWTVRPLGHSSDGLYEANAEGARAPAGTTYGEHPAAGRLRIVTVGDSFTHGDTVGVEDTWQREMERRRSDLEVVNLGVPGYGTDQAYLRWRRDGTPLHPQIALLGIWPENICRNLNVVRFFFQPAADLGFLSKPRFTLSRGGLEAVNEPVLDGEPLVDALTEPSSAPVLRDDYWAIPADLEPHAWQRLRLARVAATVANLYRRRELRKRLYAGEDPAGIEVTVAIAREFAGDARRTGAVPVVVILPMLDLLARYPDEGSFPLVRALRSAGLEVVDLGPPMSREVRDHGAAAFEARDRHLSPIGNRLVAHWLLDRLQPRLGAAVRVAYRP